MKNNGMDCDADELSVYKKDIVGDERIQLIENETINYINENMFM